MATTALRNTSLTLSQYKIRTSPITHLVVEDPFGDPKVLAAFLRWPRALEEFSLRHDLEDLSSQLLVQMLHPHKRHLRRIHLDKCKQAQDLAQSFDSSVFENLECLRLHMTNLKGDPTQVAPALFNGPIQETLVLDYRSSRFVDMDWFKLFVQAVGSHCHAALPKQRQIILVGDRFARYPLNNKQMESMLELGELARETGVKLVHTGVGDQMYPMYEEYVRPVGEKNII